jgi:hypothetical protein
MLKLTQEAFHKSQVSFCATLIYLDWLIVSNCHRSDFASSSYCCQTFYRKLFQQKFNNLFIHGPATKGSTVKMTLVYTYMVLLYITESKIIVKLAGSVAECVHEVSRKSLIWLRFNYWGRQTATVIAKAHFSCKTWKVDQQVLCQRNLINMTKYINMLVDRICSNKCVN